MKNSTTIIVSLLSIALIGGAVVYFVNDQDSSDQQIANSQNTETSTSELAPPPATEQPTNETANYVQYSDDYLETTSGTRLLFFHAEWCPQCRQLEADIAQNGLPEGVTVIEVDYDTNQQLRQKYDVTLQTTVVRVDDQGNLVDSYVPYDEPTFDNVEANLL